MLRLNSKLKAENAGDREATGVMASRVRGFQVRFLGQLFQEGAAQNLHEAKHVPRQRKPIGK